MEPEDWAVLELSSFQLMTMDRSPHIAVVTNLAPNHLDVHKDMAEYVAAKENIFTLSDAPATSPCSITTTTSPVSSAGRGRGRLSACFSRRSRAGRAACSSGGSDILCRHNGQERPDA